MLLLRVLSILFQRSYGYKTTENNTRQYEIGKFYSVKQKQKSLKVKITTKTDRTLVVWNKFDRKTLSIDEISKAERRKFSIVKSVVLPIVMLGVVVAIFASAVQVKLGPMQSPP
jgi:hypothetical protein